MRMARPPAREAPTVSEAHGSGADSARAGTALRCACAHCPAAQDAASAVQVAEPRQTSPISFLRRYVGSFVSSRTGSLDGSGSRTPARATSCWTRGCAPSPCCVASGSLHSGSFVTAPAFDPSMMPSGSTSVSAVNSLSARAY